jgi:hypothetical protein
MFAKLLLILIIVTPLFSKDSKEKLREIFERNANSAHPFLEEYRVPKFKFPSYLLQNSGESSFFKNYNAITNTENNGIVQNESSIAVNPKNPKNLIASAVDYRDNSSTWVYVSDDGGVTWRNINLGKVKGTWPSSNDPSVAFDLDGTAYLMHGAFQGVNGQNGVFIARSNDEGKTWKQHIPVIIHDKEPITLDTAFEDKYYVEVDESPKSPFKGNVYTPWKRVINRDSATQIVFTRSEDKGETWSVPVPISPRKAGTSEDTTYGQSFPLLSTGPNGELYAVWNDGIVWGVGFNRSFDAGKTWEQPRIIQYYNIFGETKFLAAQRGYRHTLKGMVRAEAYPVVQCDWTESKYSGNVYICWTADNPPNVYFAKSTDKGISWSKPKIVSSDSRNDQFWAWMAIDPKNGDIGIMYLDSRNDPSNLMVETYAALSTDGGDTWIDRKVSDVTSDIRLNPFSGSFAGDYSGLAFYDGIMYPSWVDMRNVSNNNGDNDVYTANVNTRSPRPPREFKASVISTNPKELDISWENIFESTFGKALNSTNYTIELYRDKQLIQSMQSNVANFKDKNLTPYKEYTYSIRYKTLNDSSNFVEIKATAGGSKRPEAPFIKIYNIVNENNLVYKGDFITIKIPKYREDGTTLLNNLKGILVYWDRSKTSSTFIPINDSFLSKEFELKTDLVNREAGYYVLQVALVAQYEGIPADTSQLTREAIVFNGVKKNNSDYEVFNDFEGKPFKYYIGGKWDVSNKFYKSANNCFTIAKTGDYSVNQRDTLLLPPNTTRMLTLFNDKKNVLNSDLTDLSFWHIVQTELRDSAIIEFSYNFVEWYPLNYKTNNSWEDKTLTQSDWTFYNMYVTDLYKVKENPLNDDLKNDISENGTYIVRLRFRSDGFKGNEGWLIDDLTHNRQVKGSIENQQKYLSIYPNPASSNIYIGLKNLEKTSNLQLISLFGETINNYNYEKLNQTIIIPTTELASGRYFVKVIMSNGEIELYPIEVIK